MATSTKSPGTLVSSDEGLGSTIVWSNPTNAASSNDTYATAICSLINGSFTEYLKATNFDFSGIPSGSTLNSVKARIEKKTNGTIVDHSVKEVIGGSPTGTEEKSGSNWPASDTYIEYDLDIPTLSQLKDSGFGVAIAAIRGGGVSPTASIDHIEIVVDYTEPSAGTTTRSPSGGVAIGDPSFY